MANQVKTMFEERSQTRNWLLTRKQIDQMRMLRNDRFLRRHGQGLSVRSRQETFLSVAEENMLLSSYENRLLEFCGNFKPSLPDCVKGSAFHFFKRFYLKHTVMQYDPEIIMYTSVNLACKVEECHISMKRFVVNINAESEKMCKDIIAHEILLLQTLDFEVNIHNPYRPVQGLLSLLKKYDFHADPDRFHIHTDFFINKMFMTDACLMHPPSQIGFAAVMYAAKKLGLIMDKYVIEILKADNALDQLTTLIEEVKFVRQIVKSYKKPPIEFLSVIEKKQQKCLDMFKECNY